MTEIFPISWGGLDKGGWTKGDGQRGMDKGFYGIYVISFHEHSERYDIILQTMNPYVYWYSILFINLLLKNVAILFIYNLL